MPFYFDPTYILIIIAYVITLWAQIKVKSAYAKYSKISNRAGLTGTDAAYAVLRSGGVTNVPVKAIAGELTDHYDPRDNTISLSSGVISTPSIAAVGVAAHEAGHALQYAEGYAPIKLRMAIIPVCNIASQLCMAEYLYRAHAQRIRGQRQLPYEAGDIRIFVCSAFSGCNAPGGA